MPLDLETNADLYRMGIKGSRPYYGGTSDVTIVSNRPPPRSNTYQGPYNWVVGNLGITGEMPISVLERLQRDAMQDPVAMRDKRISNLQEKFGLTDGERIELEMLLKAKWGL